jgi:hypothetical protein
MAGVVFKSETHVLMGYQPHKAMISGIGGKAHDYELIPHTAFREAVEELFGVKPTYWLIISLAEIFKHAKTVQNGGYTMFILSFDDLIRFMNYVQVSVQTSPYYAKFPESIHDLLLCRRAPTDAEVTHLALIPLVPDYFRVDQRDIPLIIQ